MIAQVETADLRWALKATAAAVETRPRMPVLAGVLIEPSERGLTFATFDLETSIVVDVAATIDGDGAAVLVAHRLLSQVAAVAGAKQLTIVVDDTSEVKVRAGKSEWTLPTFPRDDYPRLPVMPAPGGTVPADLFAGALRDVIVASARTDTIPVLTGIRIEPGVDLLRLEGTDRYRIHIAEIPWKVTTEPAAAVVVPARALKSLAGIEVGDVDLSFTSTLFAAETGHVRFTTRLLDPVPWPNVRPLVIPRARAATIVTVDPGALTLAIRQVEAGGATRVELHVETDRIRVVGRDLDAHRNVGETVIDAAVDGDTAHIGINPSFLTDALDVAGGSEVELQITKPTKPIMVGRPGCDAQLIVMPIRIGQ